MRCDRFLWVGPSSCSVVRQGERSNSWTLNQRGAKCCHPHKRYLCTATTAVKSGGTEILAEGVYSFPRASLKLVLTTAPASLSSARRPSLSLREAWHERAA